MVADTCHILFFLELATRLEYKAVQIIATRICKTFKARFKYYKRVLNISNVFETFKMRLEHLKRIF